MTSPIPLSSIIVSPTRQRRTFDETSLVELRTSLEEGPGLLHPLVIRETEEGPVLVAGERRLRAIQDLYELGGVLRFGGQTLDRGLVPVVTLGELSPLEAEEAELEENIRRVDLSWQERAAATDRLVSLRGRQANLAGLDAPPVAEVSREIYPDHHPKAAHSAVRREMIVARQLSDPEVRAAKTLDEAFKVVQKKEETAKNTRLAEALGRTYSVADLVLLNEDAQDWAEKQPGGQFDIILTDPPYGMGAHEFGDSGKGSDAAAHTYEDTPQALESLIEWFAAESFRLTRPDAHLYLFCDIDWFHTWRKALSLEGWGVHRTPLIWHNPDGYRTPWPTRGPQRKYELILYAVKGDLTVNAVRPDVITARKDSAVGYAAQKPVDLLVDLLRRSARPGSRVLDPFAGSGSTLAACYSMKLPCTSIEIDPAAYGLAAQRLANLTSQVEMAL